LTKVALPSEVSHRYTDELYAKKSEVLFEHVYEAYAGEGRSVFSETRK